MHYASLILALAAVIPAAHGHFTFVRVAVNGEWQAPFQFIRNKTDAFTELASPDTQNNYRGYHFPTYSTTDYPDSVRCGRDNMAHAADTEVLKLKAGDTLEFVTTAAEPTVWESDKVTWDGCPENRGFCSWQTYNGSTMHIIHDGPVVAHLSKVPDGQGVHEYNGSGEWIKIHTTGLEIRKQDREPVHWWPRNKEDTPPRFIFELPKQTPPGQYLLRMDLIFPGFVWYLDGKFISQSPAQLYPSCAQIEVESESTTTLPEGVLIPDAFLNKAPGIQTSIEQYRRQKVDEGYIYPGGPLWDGEKLIEDKAPSMN